MADPWTDDLAALGDRSRRQLRSIAATRASVLPKLSKESKMRMFKHHPVLATLVTLVILAVAAPLAYAVVDRVFISVDPDKSAGEIERRSALSRAVVAGALKALKDEGRLFMGGTKRFARYATSQATADKASRDARGGSAGE